MNSQCRRLNSSVLSEKLVVLNPLRLQSAQFTTRKCAILEPVDKLAITVVSKITKHRAVATAVVIVVVVVGHGVVAISDGGWEPLVIVVVAGNQWWWQRLGVGCRLSL